MEKKSKIIMEYNNDKHYNAASAGVWGNKLRICPLPRAVLKPRLHFQLFFFPVITSKLCNIKNIVVKTGNVVNNKLYI